MTVTVKQPPLLAYENTPDEPRPAQTGQPLDRYIWIPITTLPLEVPDEQIFQHIVWSGSLDWLAEPGENVYTIEDGEPL